VLSEYQEVLTRPKFDRIRPGRKIVLYKFGVVSKKNKKGRDNKVERQLKIVSEI